MLELNKILITGRLTAAPELKYLPSGMAVCDLRIASSRRYFDKKANDSKEETAFVDVTVWGKSGEFVNKYFEKGKAIFIEGRLKYDSWEKDGNKRSKLSIVAERASFAESKGESQGGSSRKGGNDSENDMPF